MRAVSRGLAAPRAPAGESGTAPAGVRGVPLAAAAPAFAGSEVAESLAVWLPAAAPDASAALPDTAADAADGTPAIAANFPRRNRIISGLSCGVLVVEAAPESGSLITARLAAEQGREVFAIPGSIHSPVARGCHKLIKQGAKLVETAQDILEELGSYADSGTPQEAIAATGDNDILKALGHDPCVLDDLVERTGLGADLLLGELLTLELDGLIATLPGNRYQRLA